MKIKELIRPHLVDIKPYSSARDEYTGKEGIFLDANENPFGSATREAFNRYPDPLQKKLKEKIAALKKISASKIFLGNGSDEPIDLLIRAFCEPATDNVIITPPTYGMYEVSAEINNIGLKKVPLTEDFQLKTGDIKKNIDKNTKIIFLCSPNNPTANSLNAADVEHILETFAGIVVIDEAYIDFSEQPGFAEKLDWFENLVILQTFSKAWGMAALRLGMAFANEDIIHYLNKIKPPYNISGATQKLALEALENVAWKDARVNEIKSLRNELTGDINKLRRVEKVFPSDANFILVKMKDAKAVFDRLIDEKIIVRNRSNVILCEGCLRITIGTKDENNALLKALQNIDK